MLKANSLKHNDSQKKAIKKEVVTILNSMDNEIKLAHEQGKNYEVSITLPINFSIPYMSNKDAQRIIYYEILKSLSEREFIVEIDLQKNSTIFYITWLSNDEKLEIDLQNNLLAKHTRRNVIN
jgi:hypothetical protein